MFERGNIVQLNHRGQLHYVKKSHRKIIYNPNLMIVIGILKTKNNKKKFLLRDAFSDIRDSYYDIHLEFVADSTQYLYDRFLK
tara:strand:+ start:159 stop:407 length:249 start_codon:yes stop_codon:yes gene_type:complete